MSISKIISIPGQPGLFKMIAQMRNGGYVVESLVDKHRIPVLATQRIVMLEDISIYTIEDEMPLKDVFLRMKENDTECAKHSAKSEPADLKSLFKKIVPKYDEERVHISDIRKMINWYGLLREIIGTKDTQEETMHKNDTGDVEKTTGGKKEKLSKNKIEAVSETEPEQKEKAPRKTAKKES